MRLNWKNTRARYSASRFGIAFLHCVLLAAYFMVPAVDAVEERDKDEPIRVYARTIEIDDRTGIAIYRGEVSMQDGTLSIKADIIKAHMKRGDVETFFAYGKPVIVTHRPADTNEEMYATADRLEYYVKREQLDMFGNVTLQQDGSELRCPELHYDLEARQFVARGNDAEGCYIFIQPRNRSRSSSNSGTKQE